MTAARRDSDETSGPPRDGRREVSGGTVRAADLRAEIRTWLDEHWDPDLTVDEWWQLVADAGWTLPHLDPGQGGRGLPRRAASTVRKAFSDHGALMPPGGLGLLMAVPTILAHGDADQIARHVRPVLEGQRGWCQLFSEPGAGSDLAGLSTRAERDGDRWVITGQKVWSSMAVDADWGMLLARTDPEVPKHAGISWFAFPLDQRGTDIRPLREMTGHAVFNEVFIDGAVCESRDLIGGEGNGWRVAQTTLLAERSGIGAGGAHASFPPAGPKGGMLGRRAGDAARDEPPEGSSPVLSVTDVIALAHAVGRTEDPLIRQRVARLYEYAETGTWNALRARAEVARGGGLGVANVAKLCHTQVVKAAAALATQLLGPAGMLSGADGADGGRYAEAMVFSPASSIYGGTDEIQRNVIGERALGLPREPKVEERRP
jgi:alkylation response protein AidB-like acyl-CoA dehydrogenase